MPRIVVSRETRCSLHSRTREGLSSRVWARPFETPEAGLGLAGRGRREQAEPGWVRAAVAQARQSAQRHTAEPRRRSQAALDQLPACSKNKGRGKGRPDSSETGHTAYTNRVTG